MLLGCVEPSRTLSPTSTETGSPMLPVIERFGLGAEAHDHDGRTIPCFARVVEARLPRDASGWLASAGTLGLASAAGCSECPLIDGCFARPTHLPWGATCPVCMRGGAALHVPSIDIQSPRADNAAGPPRQPPRSATTCQPCLLHHRCAPHDGGTGFASPEAHLAGRHRALPPRTHGRRSTAHPSSGHRFPPGQPSTHGLIQRGLLSSRARRRVR